MFGKEWEPVPRIQGIAFLVGVGLLVAIAFRSEPGFIPLLDHANLLFHEAGHPLIGLFSSALEPYGGTIGQLAFPVILAISGWRKRKLLLISGAAIWFFENLLNIARYMADARRLELPLVGGGDHDWNTILARWDILMYDTRIAEVLNGIAWWGICVSVLLVALHLVVNAGRRRQLGVRCATSE